jgi:hypothetical protein
VSVQFQMAHGSSSSRSPSACSIGIAGSGGASSRFQPWDNHDEHLETLSGIT